MTTSISRFQIVTAEQLLSPHKCSICGSYGLNDDRKFMDFGLSIDYYGNIYFCIHCFSDAAGQIDFKPVSVFNEALTQRDEFKAVVASLVSENRVLRNELDNLRHLNRPEPTSYVVYHNSSPENEAGTISTEGSPERKEGPPEPVNVEGSENLRDSDSLRDSFQSIGLNI